MTKGGERWEFILRCVRGSDRNSDKRKICKNKLRKTIRPGECAGNAEFLIEKE